MTPPRVYYRNTANSDRHYHPAFRYSYSHSHYLAARRISSVARGFLSRQRNARGDLEVQRLNRDLNRQWPNRYADQHARQYAAMLAVSRATRTAWNNRMASRINMAARRRLLHRRRVAAVQAAQAEEVQADIIAHGQNDPDDHAFGGAQRAARIARFDR